MRQIDFISATVEEGGSLFCGLIGVGYVDVMRAMDNARNIAA